MNTSKKILTATVTIGTLLILLTGCGKKGGNGITDPVESSPTIESVMPGEGTVGTELTISGSDFSSDATVKVGTVTADVVEFSSSTTLYVTVPSGITGNTALDITVTNGDGGEITSSSAFTAIDPVLSFVNSATKPSGNIGSTVIIDGKAFGDSQGDSRVLFSDGAGGTIPATIASDDDWFDTFIVTTVPSGAEDGPVFVETEIGASSSLDFNVTDAATFSPSTINWTQTTSLPQGLSGHRAVYTPIDDASGNTNSFVHVSGGRDTSAISQKDVFYGQINTDGTISSWNTATALPDSISFHASVVATPFNSKVSGKGFIYALGGVDNTGEPVSSVHFASLNEDGSINSWNTNQALPEPLHSLGAVVFRSAIYIAGGATTGDNPTEKVYKAAIDTSGNLGAWEELASMPSPRMYHGFQSFGAFLYAVGGEGAAESPDDGDFNNNDTKFSTVVYAKINLRTGDITTDGWSINVDEMSKPRSKHSALVTGGNLFVSSGLYAGSGQGSSENTFAQINSDGSVGAFGGATGSNTLQSEGGQNLYNQAAISYIDADGVAHVMILGGDDVNNPGNKQSDVLFY
ncbi:MAG: IPT/TIG domain-containing protein [Gracilimonas sp.]|uniref:IPT/TIG domain-containing protein n=1 Tax=Gracilimonas sp. TaxID=1974203 RepID=UPI00198A8B4E|nr:IPT/TIG domain-containing protein [Gracilimonas sp.]MBD3616064.1 IPT/TIG domain-containing protein [Gracilimonas sp.]